MFVDLKHMEDESRVWIFLSDRILNKNEQLSITTAAGEFISGWTAHKKDLKASFELMNNCFLVIAVDEAAVGASGCSIDAMTRFIKDIGEQHSINFFNRDLVAVDKPDGILITTISEAGKMAAADTSLVVYDTLAADLNEVRNNWKKRFVDSWHSNLV
jgi:hypothetical protein